MDLNNEAVGSMGVEACKKTVQLNDFEKNIDTLTGVSCSADWGADLIRLIQQGICGYLFICDIDNLAAINAQKGREFGDLVLQRVAISFVRRHGSHNGVYRKGGDRFAVILADYSQQQVEDFFHNVQRDLEGYCTISAGAVPFNSCEMRSLTQIVQYIDLAIMESKRNGKNMLGFFSHEKYQCFLSRLNLKEELQNSILNNYKGFFVCYQPLVDGKNFSLLGAEALLRYRSINRGLVYPGEFIGLLEETGMIRQVGKWILRQALKQCLQWRQVIPNFRVSVNVSYVQLDSLGFDQDVLDVLRDLNVPGDALTLEITESMQLRDFEKFNRIFSVWKEAGIFIAVDDFGTGYSSLSYLKKLQFDIIKIDQCFVRDITDSPYNYRVISTVLELAELAEIMVCLEGVENEDQLHLLNDLQPDIYQGYLFSKPVEAYQFTESFVNRDTEAYDEYNDKMKLFTSLDVRKRVQSSYMSWNIQNDAPGYGVVNANIDNILNDLELGLWIMRINKKTGLKELFLDRTCAELMYVSKALSPAQCYQEWLSRVSPECLTYIAQMLKECVESGRIVQSEYNWVHPVEGVVRVRTVGVRSKNCASEIILKGYHRLISNIVQTSFLDM